MGSGLNWEVLFSFTGYYSKVKKPSLSFNLPIAEGRIVGFIPFLSYIYIYIYISISNIQSASEDSGLDYSCIEYMSNII